MRGVCGYTVCTVTRFLNIIFQCTALGVYTHGRNWRVVDDNRGVNVI